MNIDELMADYRTYLQAQSKSRHTISVFIRDVLHFLTTLNNGEFVSVSAADVDRYLVAISMKKDGSPKHTNTINRTKTALRSFFAWANRTNIITTNPAEHLQMKRIDRLPPVYLTVDEEKCLFQCLQTNPAKNHRRRDIAIFRLLLDTGIRIGELVQVDFSDIDGKHLIIRHQKGGSQSKKFLPTATRAALADYIDHERKLHSADSETTALFLNQSGQRMQSRGMQFLIQKWVRIAGINKPITPHKLRHTFATSLYAKSHDILAVQKALGHRSVVHTQIYAHISDDSLELAMETRSAN